MPHIDSTQFGEIIIDWKKYGQVLIVGGGVMEREYEKLKELFGTSHQIGEWELNSLFEYKPEIIIVGTGQEGALKIEPGVLAAIKDNGIELISAKTLEAIDIYNKKTEEGRRVNALIHTTC